MKSIIIIIFSLSFVNAKAMAASSVDGNYLLQSCQATIMVLDGKQAPSDLTQVGYCLGLVGGVRETIDIIKQNEKDSVVGICVPAEANTYQLIRVIVKFLQNNPSMLHENRTALTIGALVTAFPCKK